MSSDDIRNIQRLSQQYEELSEEVEELQQAVAQLEQRIQGCNDAMDALENIENDSELLVPLGGETYVRARVEDVDDVVVGVGADVSVELGRDRAVETLEDKVDELEEMKERTSDEMQRKQEELEEVAQQAQQLQLQQQQRQRE